MDITQTFYDNMASQYDKLFLDWQATTREQAVILDRIFSAYGFDRGARVLDCACGIGTQAIGLAALGYPVTASDLSEGELAEAREKLILAEAEQIPAEQRSVILFREEMQQEQMRHLVNALTEAHDGYCGVFAGNEAEGYRFIISIREGDARIALDWIRKEMLE